MRNGIGITGLGKSLPKKKCTNEDLARRLKVTPEWIYERTGVKSRYFVNGETASSLSADAARNALKRARVKSSELGLVIGCTSSGDYLFPPMSCKVQDLIGATRAGAFDVSASSLAFQVGFNIAADRLRSEPGLNNAVVITSAIQSPYIDWKDPKISGLLGDGCAAAVISRVPKDYGLLASHLVSRGNLFEAALLRSGGTIEMDGVVMGREFLKSQPAIIRDALKKAGLSLKDVDLFIFHQANARLIQFLMERMKLPMSKTYTNAERYGNTADASTLLALCEAWEKKRVKRGDIVVLSGVGAGCLLGAVVMKWY